MEIDSRKEMNLIMFDYDGVLVDSFDFTKRIYIELCEEFDLRLPEHPEYFRELFELDWRETMKKLNLTSSIHFERSHRLFVDGLRKYDSMIRPYEKIPAVLDSLSRRYKLAIVTNNLREEIDYRLRKYDLDKYFCATFTSEDGEMKPSPDLVLKCLAKCDVSCSEAAFVGDMDGDIISGKAAKVSKMVGVAYGYHLVHRLKEADCIVKSPEELLEVFR
jgi:HAD superfamily hydrolase (TIGR01549 family)